MITPTVPTLLSLPNEILLQIGESLYISSLCSFISTNHHLRILLTPTLYSPTNFDPCSVLAWSCKNGNIFLAHRMLTFYASSVKISSPLDAMNKTALHLSAEHGHALLVPLLLSFGAQIDEFYTMPEGAHGVVHNPLQLASKDGHTDMVRALLDSGAQIEARGDRGRSALCFAAADGRMETVRLLIKRGATLYPRDAFESGIGVIEFEKRMRKWDLPQTEIEEAIRRMKEQEAKWNEERAMTVSGLVVK